MTSHFTFTGEQWNIENWRAAQRIVAAFAPTAHNPAGMQVIVGPGALLRSNAVIEKNIQVSSSFVRPDTVRVDRIVIDRNTGTIITVTGVDGSMSPPDIPDNSLPCAQIFLSSGMIAITNEVILDERILADSAAKASETAISRIERTGDQTGIINSNLTKIQFNRTSINIGNGFDIENSWFKPALAGYYNIFLQCTYNISSANFQINADIYKNGLSIARAQFGPGANSLQSVSTSDVVYLNGTTDVIEFYTAQASGGTISLFGSAQFTWATAVRVG